MASGEVPLGYIPIVASELVPCKLDSSQLSQHVQRLLERSIAAIPETGSLANVSSPVCMPVAKTQDPEQQLWFISITLSYYDVTTARSAADNKTLPEQVAKIIDTAAVGGARVKVVATGTGTSDGVKQSRSRADAARDMWLSGRSGGHTGGSDDDTDDSISDWSGESGSGDVAMGSKQPEEVPAATDNRRHEEVEQPGSSGLRTRYGFPDPRQL